MKKYKTVLLNKGLNFGRAADLGKVDENLNKLSAEGWTLVNALSPNDMGGAIVGIFEKEDPDGE